jgi:hypothetical protein
MALPCSAGLRAEPRMRLAGWRESTRALSPCAGVCPIYRAGAAARRGRSGGSQPQPSGLVSPEPSGLEVPSERNVAFAG